jgi:hypothetical protein
VQVPNSSLPLRLRDWLHNRIDGLVDTFLGLGIVMAVISLSIPLFTKIAILASLPLGLYALLKAMSSETQDTKLPEAMTVVELYDPMPPPKVVPVSLGGKASSRFTLPDEPGIGRNDPCWCRSGKKYKRCHGA